jgi:N-dimethylarginine dimethylaminohydrolase
MSDARSFTNEQAINPYYGETGTSTELAQAEHDSIRQALELSGVTVNVVPAPKDSQDGVYTANWALVRGNKAVLARLPNVRKAEETYAEEVLIKLGKEVIHAPEGTKFSGQGDALACGDLLFCGRGYRSDESAQKFAAEQLGYTRIQLETVPERDTEGNPVINPISGWADSYFYDIDLALSILRHPSDDKKGLIAYCPEAFTAQSQQILHDLESVEKIPISLDEALRAFASNLVSTGETVIMSDQAPHLKAAIESKGLAVVTPHITELAKGGGYIRCTSLSLD